MIKAILTKPLDGQPEGTEREFDKADFAALEAMGAVRKASDLREDGPTIAEFVAAGYPPENYPPAGYAARSTPEEVAAAVAAASAGEDAAKKAAAPQNKMAPPVLNKSSEA